MTDDELRRVIESIRVEFSADVVAAVRTLYETMGWQLPSPDLDVWMFDELCALYFRLNHHIDALPEGSIRSVFFAYVQAHINAYLEDEVS